MKVLKTSAFWQILAILLLLVATLHVPAQTNQAAARKNQPVLVARLDGEREILSFVEPTLAKSRPPRVVSSERAFVSTIAPTSLEQEAFDLINAERAKINLPPLELDAAMLYLARRHSENMAQNNFFSHRGTDGARVDERARQIGVRDWQGIGENIAANQNEKNPVAVAVECWLKSIGHRSNILSKTWARAGIGIAVSPDGKFYITQVFRD